MKARSVKGAAAGVALVTVAAMSATAMPQVFSESDSKLVNSNKEPESSITEVPDLPDDATIAKAKEDPSAQAKLREDLKEILDKSNQRLADVEAETLTANEKARELGEAAAEARREAETAAQQAELAAEQHEQDQENAGEAVADMYRNGGLTTEEFLLGDDEDALADAARGQQLAEGLAGQAGTSQTEQQGQEHLAGEAASKSEALDEAEEQAKAKAEEEERLRREAEAAEREREEAEAARLAALEQEDDRQTQAAASAEEAGLNLDELEEEVIQERFHQNTGEETTSPEASPTSTEAVDEAPVTEEPSEDPSPTETTSSTPEASASSTPEPTPSSSPSQSATSTPTRTATPTPTPTPTRTQSQAPRAQAQSQTQTQTQKPKPAPKKTVAPASTGSNMSAAVNWAVNKTKESGTYYSWGGNGPKGYDCSGFTSAAFAQAGKSLPRTSSAQYGAAKQYVSLNNLQPGDLVFWSNNGQQSGIYHVAIYIGNGQIAHARNPSTGITITGLHYSPWNMMSVGGRY